MSFPSFPEDIGSEMIPTFLFATLIIANYYTPTSHSPTDSKSLKLSVGYDGWLGTKLPQKHLKYLKP